MHIQSKLIEAQKTVCDLHITDNYKKGDPIIVKKSSDEAGKHIHINSKLMYTSGCCIMESNFSIFKKVTDYFSVHGEHLQLTFFLDGKSRVTTPLPPLSYELNIGFMRRNYLPVSQWSIEMRGNNVINYIAVFISKRFLSNLLENEIWKKNDFLTRTIISDDNLAVSDETRPITSTILKTLRELLDNDKRDEPCRRFYFELKLKELLFLVQEQYLIPSNHASVSPELFDTLEKVRAYLITHFNAPPTIKQLSRMFSLNELKLKQNFKTVYGTTIYAFVIQLRMEKANKMLLEDYSVSEMSYALGYRSVSHFISTYKNYFGQTPKKALMKISQAVSMAVLFLQKLELFYI